MVWILFEMRKSFVASEVEASLLEDVPVASGTEAVVALALQILLGVVVLFVIVFLVVDSWTSCWI